MPKIEELYAWIIAEKDDNDEGVPAIAVDNMVMPLMGADIARADSMRAIAQTLADDRGKEVKLIKSTGIQIVEIVKPKNYVSQ